MKTILTLKYGDKYTADDVNKIYTDTDGKYNYVCVTDNPKGLRSDIYTIAIDGEPEGHWEKIKLFQYNDLGKILYLDLDIVIQKDIDYLFDCLDKSPMICYTYWKPNDFPYHKDERWSYNYLSNFNSSVMLWEDARHIYEYWKENKDYYMVKYAGDDRFLFHENFTFEHWPKGEIYSFKFDGAKYNPDASIALLNGQEAFPNLVEEYEHEFRMYQMGR
jgi:hypothetical protein